mmetsp:Transcript_49172/g.136339  ORF Transcript_49172/g.136339 Transcript_49172/m.136339 type:complete len:228 (+) Transcript_49172:122-805(+)
MQPRAADRVVACAAPATPSRAMKGPLRTALHNTVAAAIASAGLVSPMPLKPADAQAAAESGSAPSAVTRRYAVPAAAVAASLTPTRSKYFEMSPGCASVAARTRDVKTANQRPCVTAAPTPSWRSPAPSAADESACTPTEDSSPAMYTSHTAKEAAPIAWSCAAPRRPMYHASICPSAVRSKPMTTDGQATLQMAALSDRPASKGGTASVAEAGASWLSRVSLTMLM